VQKELMWNETCLLSPWEFLQQAQWLHRNSMHCNSASASPNFASLVVISINILPFNSVFRFTSSLHLWLSSNGILGWFQASPDCPSISWYNSSSAPPSTRAAQIWQQYKACWGCLSKSSELPQTKFPTCKQLHW